MKGSTIHHDSCLWLWLVRRPAHNILRLIFEFEKMLLLVCAHMFCLMLYRIVGNARRYISLDAMLALLLPPPMALQGNARDFGGWIRMHRLVVYSVNRDIKSLTIIHTCRRHPTTHHTHTLFTIATFESTTFECSAAWTYQLCRQQTVNCSEKKRRNLMLH